MNDVQEVLARLKLKGWTMAAIADELDTHYNTVQKWAAGDRFPANAMAVKHELERLLVRRRIPKGKRYKKAPQP